jgi:hypothetical protein
MTEFETKMLELQFRALERLEQIEAVATWFQKRIERMDQIKRTPLGDPPGYR